MNSFAFALVAALLVGPQNTEARVAPTSQEVVIPAPGPGAPADMQLVVYDLADVLDLLREPATDESQLDENLSPREREEKDAAHRALFLEDAKRWMVPAFDQHGSLVFTTGGALVANLTAEQQTWLRAFVDCQRTSVQRVFVVETQFVRADPKSFDAMQLADQSVVIGRAPEQRASYEALLTSDGVEILSAPRITSYARQAAEIAIVSEIAYVREYVFVMVAPGNQHILDPIVDVVEDGIRTKTRVVALPGGKLGLALDVSFMEVAQPIETTELTVAGYETPVTVARPKQSTTQLVARFELERGETLLVSGRGGMSGEWPLPSVFGSTAADGKRRELVVAVRVGEVVEVQDPNAATTLTEVLFSAF
jgi:hypothetical protein